MKNLFALMAALVAFTGIASGEPEINVTGTGTVKAKPDMAVITFGVTTKAKTAAEATKENATISKKVCCAIEGCKVKSEDIQTTGYSVSTEYSFSDKESKFVGYAVNNEFTVTVRDLSTLGRLIDDTITSGATQIRRLIWDVSNKDNIYADARKKAFADAKQRASLYAEQAGVKLGSLKMVNEGRVYSRELSDSRFMYDLAEAPGSMRSTTAKPGEMTIHIDINVTWSIDQK